VHGINETVADAQQAAPLQRAANIDIRGFPFLVVAQLAAPGAMICAKQIVGRYDSIETPYTP
jgi:hypothetical protein